MPTLRTDKGLMPVLIYGDFKSCPSSIAALKKLKSHGIKHTHVHVSLAEFRAGTSKPINDLGGTYTTIPIIFAPRLLKGGNDALTEAKLASLSSPKPKRKRSRSRSRSRSRPRRYKRRKA